MKIVVLDSAPLDAGDLDWSAVRAFGELTLHTSTAPELVAERIADADIVLTNKVPVRAAAITSAAKLKLITVLATGYDVVDIAAAKAQGVTVCNVPGYSSEFTAQTAIALLLALTHRIGEHAESVRNGDWSRSPTFGYWKYPLFELQGKTLAIFGLGTIGCRVAEIAEAFHMRVVAGQFPGREPTDAPFARVPVDEAFAIADVVSLHCPLTDQTRGFVNAQRLALLDPGALLVNTARGALIDDLAVVAALKSGQLGGYAADVLAKEPPPADNPLIGAPNTIITPHLGWASPEARRRMLASTVANIAAFQNKAPQNVVS